LGLLNCERTEDRADYKPLVDEIPACSRQDFAKLQISAGNRCTHQKEDARERGRLAKKRVSKHKTVCQFWTWYGALSFIWPLNLQFPVSAVMLLCFC